MKNPNCIEQEVVERHGGKVDFVPRIGNYSTTNIIKKVVAYYDWLDEIGAKLDKTGKVIFARKE